MSRISHIFMILPIGYVAACSGMLTYAPSEKYDNRIVRGVVTHKFSPSDMERNWKKMAPTVIDPPDLEDFIKNYNRVTVAIERSLGSALLVYPFVPDRLVVDVGDIVDVPIYVGGPMVGKFSGRPQILRVVCRAADSKCIHSREGSLRGDTGPVESILH